MKNSVVLATYNGEKYIVEQLDSIRNQTLPPDEVVIRDDGSTDHTSEIIKKYIVDYGLNWDFKINEKNKGFYFNFIDAIKECTGNVIYLSDQDDVWDLRKIKIFSSFYQMHPEVTMIQSSFKFIDGDGNDLSAKELYHGKKPAEEPIFLNTIDMFKFAGSGFTMSFRSSVSDRVFEEGFEKKIDVFVYHDLLLGQMATVLGNCYLMTGIVDAHRLHANNETQQKGKSSIADRTKQMQLDILKRRSEQCDYISKIASSKKNEDIQKIKCFTDERIMLIRNKKIGKVKELARALNLYMSKRGLVTDIMYAFGMEKVLLELYKKM